MIGIPLPKELWRVLEQQITERFPRAKPEIRRTLTLRVVEAYEALYLQHRVGKLTHEDLVRNVLSQCDDQGQSAPAAATLARTYEAPKGFFNHKQVRRFVRGW